MTEEKENGLKTFFSSPTTFMLFLNLIVLVITMGIFWGTETSHISDLRERVLLLSTRLDSHEKIINDDRNAVSNRLTGLESEAKYISQTLQELKLIVTPIPRRN